MNDVFNDIDRNHMKLALDLAEKGAGLNHPNPLVGAVVARGNRILGTGYHLYEKVHHAETIALSEAGEAAKGATIYINLEPCAHENRTPSCVHAIHQSGIKRVVFAIQDTDERVRGEGEAYLQNNGIHVDKGLFSERATELNRDYLKAKETDLPWIVVKVAASLDGKIGLRNVKGEYFSSTQSLRVAHQLRAWCDGIMIGASTVRIDNPQLTCRLDSFETESDIDTPDLIYPLPQGKNNPVRIVISRTMNIPPDSQILNTSIARTVLITGDDADVKSVDRFRSQGLEILQVESLSEGISLTQALRELCGLGIMNIVVEGGGKLIGSLLSQHLEDEMYISISPVLIGGVDSPGWLPTRVTDNIAGAPRMQNVDLFKVGRDVMIRARRSDSDKKAWYNLDS